MGDHFDDNSEQNSEQNISRESQILNSKTNTKRLEGIPQKRRQQIIIVQAYCSNTSTKHQCSRWERALFHQR